MWKLDHRVLCGSIMVMGVLTGRIYNFHGYRRTFTSLVQLKGNFVVHRNHFAPYGEVVLGSYISVYAGYRKMNLILQLPRPIATTSSAQATDVGEKVDRIYNISFPNEVPGIAEDEFTISLDTPLECTPSFPRGVNHGTFTRLVSAMLIGEETGRLHGLVLEEIPRSSNVYSRCEVACRRIGYFMTRANHKKMDRR